MHYEMFTARDLKCVAIYKENTYIEQIQELKDDYQYYLLERQMESV